MSLEPILESTECWCRSNVGLTTVTGQIQLNIVSIKMR